MPFNPDQVDDEIQKAIDKAIVDAAAANVDLSYFRDKVDASTYPDAPLIPARRWKDREHFFVYMICRCRPVGKGAHGCFGARSASANPALPRRRFRDLGR